MDPDFVIMGDVLRGLFNVARSPGLIEIAWTDPDAPFRLRHARQFTPEDIDAAAAHAADLNRQPGRNVYFGPGLRRLDTDPARRASDAQVSGISCLWTDHDDEASFCAAFDLAAKMGLAPSFSVQTGSFPSLRGHLWWKLDTICHDLDAHRIVQRSMARVFRGDTSVINPSRLMRLPGSIAWPTKPGRLAEITKIHAGSPHSDAIYALKDFDKVIQTSREA